MQSSNLANPFISHDNVSYILAQIINNLGGSESEDQASLCFGVGVLGVLAHKNGSQSVKQFEAFLQISQQLILLFQQLTDSNKYNQSSLTFLGLINDICNHKHDENSHVNEIKKIDPDFNILKDFPCICLCEYLYHSPEQVPSLFSHSKMHPVNDQDFVKTQKALKELCGDKNALKELEERGNVIFKTYQNLTGRDITDDLVRIQNGLWTSSKDSPELTDTKIVSSCIYSVEEVKTYAKSIESAMSDYLMNHPDSKNTRIQFLSFSTTHGAGFGYDGEKKTWFIVDSLNLSSNNLDQGLTSDEFANKISMYFSNNQCVGFTSIVYAESELCAHILKYLNQDERWNKINSFDKPNMHDLENKVYKNIKALKFIMSTGDTEFIAQSLNSPYIEMSILNDTATLTEVLLMALNEKHTKLLTHVLNMAKNHSLSKLNNLIRSIIFNDNYDDQSGFFYSTLYENSDSQIQTAYLSVLSEKFCMQNDLNSLKDLESKMVNLNYKNEFGKTLLMIAIQSGSSDVIDFLLSKKPSFEEQDFQGKTVLDYSLSSDNVDIFKKILGLINESDKNNNDKIVLQLDRKDSDGQNALFKAIRKWNVDITAELLKYDIDITVVEPLFKQTALEFANKLGQQVVIDQLLTKGIQLAIKNDDYNLVALKVAALNDKIDFFSKILCLLSTNFDKDHHEETMKLIDLLLTENKFNLLNVFINNRGLKVEVYKILNEMLSTLINPNDDLDANKIAALIKCGANPDIQTKSGFSLLMKLCKSEPEENIEYIKFLVNSGVDLNFQTNKSRYTALDYARMSDNSEVMELLLKSGAKIYTPENLNFFKDKFAENTQLCNIITFNDVYTAVMDFLRKSRKSTNLSSHSIFISSTPQIQVAEKIVKDILYKGSIEMTDVEKLKNSENLYNILVEHADPIKNNKPAFE